ncbi:hypothetical protein CVT25_002422 [Psilocybe cyanescens]|uniref:Uncharacterized protein n=1 Tax=Psilocybe cyanescens TaxID=93625 RepID=A0A409WKD7_PSICY|nr:hypothetical protein CVT25_002422 [Psilocybe cyanescens]
MADPLSITLATISLATALKDIIELAQMIEESFATVRIIPPQSIKSQSDSGG